MDITEARKIVKQPTGHPQIDADLHARKDRAQHFIDGAESAADRLELLLAKYGDRFKMHKDARILVEMVIMELRREQEGT